MLTTPGNPATIAAEGFKQVFYKVWDRSLQYFRNLLFERLKNGTFIGNPSQFLVSEVFDYSHPTILENLKLGPEWWDKFKSEILEFSLIFQKENLSEKKTNFHVLQRDFYRLKDGDPAKGEIEKELELKLKEITAEFNFQKAKDKRLNT